MVVGQGANQWTTVYVAEMATRCLRLIKGTPTTTAPEGLIGIYYPTLA